MAVNMTEKEYREQFQLYMLQASMEPNWEKRKEISEKINKLEKRHEQLRFRNPDAELEEMFAETGVNMDSETIFGVQQGGKVR